jgi:hypothetical protein
MWLAALAPEVQFIGSCIAWELALHWCGDGEVVMANMHNFVLRLLKLVIMMLVVWQGQ